jgi:hypothetical protein
MSKLETWQRGAAAPARSGILGEHSGGELSWSEPGAEAPELTDEDREGVKQRMAAVDKLFAEQGLAKYKIELMFGLSRSGTSRHQPIPGIIQYLESGGKTHAGGDVKLYICPGKTFKQQGMHECATPAHEEHHLPAPKASDCEAPLVFSRNGFGLIYCGACRQLWAAEQVVGEIAYRLPMRKWAEVVYKHFHTLEMNADVVVKFTYDDLRAATLMEQARELRGDKLTPVRQNRPTGIYRLPAILKDVNAGADLLKRFYAFLTV